eukprot:CAMPEP_0195283662 /NCGR_PEP_ID=MMETSP0707-20130614/2132_1 /TAXON_ID=33640 /ORGANISM="Asterionellopsis glacialis, Strain CCMP134" /LENGTH=129 /DNA_ID=CAMNT_0040342869 /DNA_START=81 /DNA_END=468 /DNA_ORIENTATION=+
MAKSATSKASLNKKTAAVAAPKKKNRTRKNKPSYARFINRVLKQVHPDTGISKKGMVVMDNMIEDMFERLASEAKELNSKKKKATMQVFDIQQQQGWSYLGNSQNMGSVKERRRTKISKWPPRRNEEWA